MAEAISRASLRNQVDQFGQPYDDTIRQQCENINAQHRDDSQPGGFRRAEELGLPLETEDDYWNFRRKDASDLAKYAAKLINQASDKGLIDSGTFSIDPSLRELAGNIDDVTKFEGLQAIVSSIPVVHLFEPHFGALASPGEDDVAFPHIRHAYTTERAIQIIAHTLVRNSMYIDHDLQAINLVPPSSVDAFNPDSAIQVTLDHILNSLLERYGGFDYQKMPAYSLTSHRADRPLVKIAATFSMGGKMLIWLHEIAHHLLGHLHDERSLYEQETEADLFALSAILGSDQSEVTYQLLAGAQVPFEMMRVLAPNPNGYPDPGERANRILSLRLSAEDRSMTYEYVLVPLHVAVLRRQNVAMSEIRKYLETHVFEYLLNQGKIPLY